VVLSTLRPVEHWSSLALLLLCSICGSLLWSTIEIPLGLAPGCSSSFLSTRGGKDLPLYCHLIEPKMGSAKCKFTGTSHPDQPKAEKVS